jgi:c-di-GMP-binding flagellar brake protein YcgR
MSVAWYNSRVFARSADWVQRRKSERRRVNLMAVILAEGDGTTICQCTMSDVSQGGTKLMVERPSTIPESFVLVLSRDARTHRKCKVRWRSETAIGVEFIRD